MTFDEAVQFTLQEECGDRDIVTVDPADPGGVTKWGIAQRFHPGVDVRNLTRTGALAIYWAAYWNVCRCDELSDPLRLAVFDAAVNPGPGMSIRFLQRAIGVTADGVIGLQTLSVAAKVGIDALPKMLTERVLYYGSRDGFNRFGEGWTGRCFRLLKYQLHNL